MKSEVIKLDHDCSHYYQPYLEHLKDAAEHASPIEKNSSPSPPLFLRLALLVSCPGFDSPSLGSTPSELGWASWFSLLSPVSWLLSDFLSGFSLLFSFSLREEGGFFPLLLRTFCCCCIKTNKPQQKGPSACFSQDNDFSNVKYFLGHPFILKLYRHSCIFLSTQICPPLL